MNNNIKNEVAEYQKQFDGSPAEQYVIGRGISKETYKQFDLGYKKQKSDLPEVAGKKKKNTAAK